MKTSSLIAAVAFAFAGSAFAQEAVYEQPQPAVSQKTRAEVLSELAQARAAGTLQLTEADRQADAPFVATRSRADVRAETLAAAASGELRALNRESNGFDGRFVPVLDAGRTLAAVR